VNNNRSTRSTRRNFENTLYFFARVFGEEHTQLLFFIEGVYYSTLLSLLIILLPYTKTMNETPCLKSPVAQPPQSSPEQMRVNEIEELRQRGLTKSWTKHFSTTIRKVEADLELASVALMELAARKAKMQKSAPPSSNELTQLDTMYLKVAEWKKECHKKQQETVMLYGRYVEKYGNSHELANPESIMTPRKGSVVPPVALSTPLATADVEELAKAFEETPDGIPEFLRPSSSPSSSPMVDTSKLQEILEEASLSEVDVPCKTLGISPTHTDVTVVESDDDDASSIVSGLTTINSATTKQVLHDVENKVLDFIKNETEHIRKLIEEGGDIVGENLTPSVSSRRAGSQVDSISDQSLHKAENMVLAMQKILDDFKKQEETEQASVKTTMIRRLSDAGAEGEEWYEHYDDAFQRHFYVEAKTKTTQWHMPPSVTESSWDSSTSVCDSATVGTASERPYTEPKVLGYEDFKPQARQVRRKTHMQKFRAKQRRQRRRRIAATTALLIALGGAVLYYKNTRPVEFESMMGQANKAVEEALEYAPFDMPKPVPSMNVVEVPKKNPAAEVKKTNGVETKPSTVEFSAMMESLIFDSSKQLEVVKEEKNGEPPEKNRNWFATFAKALLGPSAYQEVNKKCRQNGRYCGDHWN